MRADYRSADAGNFEIAAPPWHSFCRSRVLQLTLALTLPVGVHVRANKTVRVVTRKRGKSVAKLRRQRTPSRVLYARGPKTRKIETKVQKRRDETRLISAPAGALGVLAIPRDVS